MIIVPKIEIKEIPLHVLGMIRVNGGVFFKKDGSQNVTDIQGRVLARQMPNGLNMMIFERGNYVIQFECPRPEELNNNTGIVSYEVRQSDLYNSGMHLEVHDVPFEGFLIAGYSGQIELGAKIATLVIKTTTYETQGSESDM
jgi:hypothetical protein